MLIDKKNLLTQVDPRLQSVVNRAAELLDGKLDVFVVCGHRGEAEQNDAFARGASKMRFPNSKHNKSPSLAVDLAPYVGKAIPWKNIQLFKEVMVAMKEAAKELQIQIVCGGDWIKFKDYPHFELWINGR